MTQETVKNLAASLKGALASKGIDLQLGQALDVMALLSGTKDWNALSATLKNRRSNLALRHALRGMLDAAAQLAEEAGDVPEWNDGGFAREACKTARTALTTAPNTEMLDGSVDYEMAVNAESQSLWVGVDNISVYIRRNDEGVSVDLYPKGDEDAESLAGTWALFADAEPDADLDTDGPAKGWTIYSANEAALSDGAGYWSNSLGWVTETDATVFMEHEKPKLNLPISTGNDAKWVPPLRPYLVSLSQDAGDEPILFNCMAEGPEHAKEQAENAYPGCVVHTVELDEAGLGEFKASNNSGRARVQRAYQLIASATAWRIDGSPLIDSMQLAVLADEFDPENQVFHFNWVDAEGDLCSETLAEGDLATAMFEGSSTLLFPEGDGGAMTLECLVLAAAEIGEPKGTPHICGLPGEHFGVCPACQEMHDWVAEWVGLHYGVNFSAFSAGGKAEWVTRYAEAHAETGVPRFSRMDWDYEVANGDTKLGYAEWVAHKLESLRHNRERGLD